MGEFDRFPWSAVPPQQGETVLGCGHTAHTTLVEIAPNPRNGWQWYELSRPAVSPLGFQSRWLVCCDACFGAAGRDASRVIIREHWTMDPDAKPDHHGRLLALQGDREKIAAYLEDLAAAGEFEALDQLARKMANL